MTEISTDTQSVIMEREFPHPPERIWRVQPQLIQEWRMKNDFQLLIGHPFELRGDWGSVACKVLEIDSNRTLVYSWEANGLESVVTWTLVPSATGTSLCMEQSGFHADHEQFYQGAEAGWSRFFASLEQVLGRLD